MPHVPCSGVYDLVRNRISRTIRATPWHPGFNYRRSIKNKMANVVIVESPSKAKTINKYLGSDYTVLASYGHIRDFPSKNGSVSPDEDFKMIWEIDSKSQKQIKEITAAMKGADRLYLATDPDREGEAISWHVQEVLNEKKLLDGVEVKRVVFNEITKSAILEAFSHPRELDKELGDAYLARRALDYLVGFTLSPVLWRKLPGSRSAGRVCVPTLAITCRAATASQRSAAAATSASRLLKCQ